MAEKKQQMPTSAAGLVRYDEDEESLIKLKPIHIIAVSVALTVIELLLFLLA
jgi:preprotein translocase subunit Sec61beta